MRAIFYDTWAFVALANAGDPHHGAAAEADRLLGQEGFVCVTSDFVLDEALTALHAAAGSRVALEFADLVEAQAAADELLLVEVNAPRRTDALSIFRRLAPGIPRLSFTDCTSFALMRELGIRVAFTADRHFLQAGAAVRPLFERHGGELRWRMPAG